MQLMQSMHTSSLKQRWVFLDISMCVHVRLLDGGMTSQLRRKEVGRSASIPRFKGQALWGLLLFLGYM